MENRKREIEDGWGMQHKAACKQIISHSCILQEREVFRRDFQGESRGILWRHRTARVNAQRIKLRDAEPLGTNSCDGNAVPLRDAKLCDGVAAILCCGGIEILFYALGIKIEFFTYFLNFISLPFCFLF